MTTMDPPLTKSAEGWPLSRWLFSFDAPNTLEITEEKSGIAVHLLQLAVFMIVLVSNFSTTPWKTDPGGQYFFSAQADLFAVESMPSVPRISVPQSDAWRIRAVAGTAVDGSSWDVAELHIWTSGVDDSASQPFAISSGSVSDATHGSVSGYEADKAFDQNSETVWGGRKDADGELWIGLQYKEPVQIKTIRLMQSTAATTSHIATHVGLECKRDGIWEKVEVVALLAKGGVYENAFTLEDADDALAQRLEWVSDTMYPGSAFSPSQSNCSSPTCNSEYFGGAPSWTMDQIVPANGQSSLFIPFRSVDQIEVFRTCRASVTESDFVSQHCSTDEECRKKNSDAMSVCGGDGTCIIRRWCPLPGRSRHHDFDSILPQAQYEVIARLKPFGKTQIYSNYKSASPGEQEVCISCRFEPTTLLSILKGRQQVREDVMSRGLEIEHTFHWQCPSSKAQDRYGCNVWTDQTVTQDQFSMSTVTFPVARNSSQGELLRRRVTFYGMNIYFKGEGSTDSYTAHPVLNFFCQMFSVVFIASCVGTAVSFLLPGGCRRYDVAQEVYPECLHASLRKVVKLKKAAQPDLQGLTDHRLHRRVKEDVEILTGLDFNKPQNRPQVSKCIGALMKHKGSPIGAAKDIGSNDTENLRILAEALRLGAAAAEIGPVGAAASCDTGSEDSFHTHSTV